MKEERINIIGQNGNDGIHYEQEKEPKPLEVYGEKKQPPPPPQKKRKYQGIRPQT